MSTICVCLAKDPLRRIFAFEPGEKIHINLSFDEELIPNYYRLQILDNRQNSRLNRYGKGSSEIAILNWPIPKTIRKEHLGVWQVWITDRDDEKKSFGQFFFVEHKLRSELPLLEGIELLNLPEGEIKGPIAVEDEIPVTQSEDEVIVQAEEPITEIYEGFIEDYSSPESEIITPDTITTKEHIVTSAQLVTVIKGLGKTYAGRLAKISIYTLSEFWYYSDRDHLADVMRVSDRKLSVMMLDAEILLSQEAEKSTIPVKEEQIEVIPDDLLSINGIGHVSVDRLLKLGITSKSDLLDYEDLERLRKTLRMSKSRLERILASIGRIIAPLEAKEPRILDPMIQPVVNIKGIGIKTAEKLNRNGIITVKDLLASNFPDLTGIPKNSYLKWRKNALIFTGHQPEIDIIKDQKIVKTKDLTSIPGIGKKTQEKLNFAGIMSISDLADYSNIDHIVNVTKISRKRLSKWQSSAKRMT
jgi:predicted flap endonuclease-1-like 5' DNA nuclease